MANTWAGLRLIGLGVVMLCSQPAWADWRSALPDARLTGSGEYTWFGLRLYTARLWSAGPVQGWQRPFALELIYHRALSRDALVQASMKEIQRMADQPLPPDTAARWAQAMAEAFVDVRPGMRITGVYLPGQGGRFYVDGQPSGEIADPAFARAFFAIWLDPRTRDPQLRQQLLGQAGAER
ncbi:chalcone isomerase family protein [Pseudomonas sp. PSKL.D1]|uniref:chalcone isomerase family protein n=1 Tax=Pseudomonas sp. PSKL.D1 TaxID=3029060 RepID=UPI002380D216|nr:chalcone isomerase family protein [Pseudomonas sp. PSKL.D1]WDY55904.1 chalcone isomerase family protein [Pseudomonas sp. PSKL.D1]